MLIFLLGMPGSGKTTLGKQLAKHYNYDFVDTDDMIVQKDGRSIEEIFNEEGEEYFRFLEKKMLEEIIGSDLKVISTGGGLPCFYNNMEVMKAHGKTVFIDVPYLTIVDRLMLPGRAVRPMVVGKSKDELGEFIHQKIKERRPFYSKATFTVFGENIQLKEIIAKINADEK